MPDGFVEAFVDKLILLERATGKSATYRIMPPPSGQFRDTLAVQKAAKDIALFAGLGDSTFVVTVAKQKEKVGGHIDLSDQNGAVFIEVDPEMTDFPDTLTATLCHEVSHKWLQVHGIRSLVELDNEILTDVAGVFLGFGKIMLNGSLTEYTWREPAPNGTQTTTRTTAVGYLDRNQLAFVYSLVCAMRRVPESELMRGLSAAAECAVRTCSASFGHHYPSDLHETGAPLRSVEGFMSKVVQGQSVLADLDKHTTYIRRGLCETFDGALRAGHKKLESLRQQATALNGQAPADPALHFLLAMKLGIELGRLAEQVHSLAQQTDGLLAHAKEIGEYLWRHGEIFPPPSPAMFNVVTCPQDGTRLRLPESSGDVIAICPTCRYRFAYAERAEGLLEGVDARLLGPYCRAGQSHIRDEGEAGWP